MTNPKLEESKISNIVGIIEYAPSSVAIDSRDERNARYLRVFLIAPHFNRCLFHQKHWS